MTFGGGNYRQGQQPFGGRVPPAGDVLVFQEEFDRGVGGAAQGGAGPGSAGMPTRWRAWTPVGVNPASVRRYIQANQQRAIMIGVAPDGFDVQYIGSGVSLSPDRLTWTNESPEEPNEQIALLQVYCNLGFGPLPFVNGDPADDTYNTRAQLIISPSDLSTSGDVPFVGVGLKQNSEDGDWFASAALTNALDSKELLSEITVPLGAVFSALFRVGLVIERERDSDEDPWTYETECFAQVSLDDGASWMLYGDAELKGGDDDQNFPFFIGFGVTGDLDEDEGEESGPSRGVGSFDFLRVYQPAFTVDDDLEDVLMLGDANGGRNWP